MLGTARIKVTKPKKSEETLFRKHQTLTASKNVHDEDEVAFENE